MFILFLYLVSFHTLSKAKCRPNFVEMYTQQKEYSTQQQQQQYQQQQQQEHQHTKNYNETALPRDSTTFLFNLYG